MNRSERVSPGGSWIGDLEARLIDELARHGFGDAAARQALAAAISATIGEAIDQHLDEVYSHWADLTAGRAKELLRRSLQGSFRRELKHIIRETLAEAADGGTAGDAAHEDAAAAVPDEAESR